MSNHPTPHVPIASSLGISGTTPLGISNGLRLQPSGSDSANVLDWCAPPGTLQPADECSDTATATQPTMGHNRNLPLAALNSGWSEGQQIPEQAGYSPHPLTAEAANPAADFPDARPADGSVAQPTQLTCVWRMGRSLLMPR